MKYKKFLKEPNFRHFDRLTSSLGLWQHAKFRVPDPEFGFSIDDNARGLIIMLKYWLIHRDAKSLSYAEIYLDYLKRAQNPDGSFHNFADSKGKFSDRSGSEDSFGRTFWALSFAVYAGVEPFARIAEKIMAKAKKRIPQIQALRAKAFILLGFYYLKDQAKVDQIADDLVDAFKANRDKDWVWFENNLTYSNALFCQALFTAYKLTGKKKYLNVAIKTFDFLLEALEFKGHPSPVGQAGWFNKGQSRALFDQQAVDVGKMVSTSLLAYDITKKKKYLSAADNWFGWFHKNNIGHYEMIDSFWGGCYDGITPQGVNKNMGAESTIAYLMAYLDFANLAVKISESLFNNYS